MTASDSLRGLALLVLPALSACGGTAPEQPLPGRPIVFVQAPRGAATQLLSFREPCVSGSQVAVWNAARPEQPPRLLSTGFEAAGAPAVNSQGTQVLFTGRLESDQRWRIYEISIQGGRPRPISPEDAHATSAAYLPDGRVVFASDLERTVDPRDGLPAYSLYTSQPDGSERTRITFNLFSDIEPTVLGDGRILYAARQPPGPDRRDGAFTLLTVANDGTGVAAFCGSHDRLGDKRHPRQIGDKLVFLAGAVDPILRAVELRRPLHTGAPLARGGDRSFHSAAAFDRGLLLVSRRPTLGDGGQPKSFGLYALQDLDSPNDSDRTDAPAPRLLLDDPELDEFDAVPAWPRPLPSGRLSLVDQQRPTGELLCLDARLTDRLEPGDTRNPVSVRIYRGTPLPLDGSRRERRAPLDPPSTLLGTIPLHEDGSFLLEAPADTPLRFETLDRQGRVILDSNGWVWVRPNERRACVGCHQDREQAPRNRVPDALRVLGTLARPGLPDLPGPRDGALAEGGRAVK